MFIPGETIIHNFVIPFKVINLTKIIVTYEQNDHIVLERTVTSFSMYVDPEGHVDPAKSQFRVTLSQEESLLFEDNKHFSIQLNVYADGNSRHASAIIRNVNGPQYHREVI